MLEDKRKQEFINVLKVKEFNIFHYYLKFIKNIKFREKY